MKYVFRSNNPQCGSRLLHPPGFNHGLSSYLYIQALFRVGVDPRIVNYDGKTAAAYLRNNSTLVTALYKAYGEGIWAAIETTNIPETERLVKGENK